MEASVLVAVTACLVVVLFVKWFIAGRRKPPGPLGLPIVGYIPFLSRSPYLDLQRLAKRYGNIFSIRLGSQYIVVLNDFQSTKDAFAQDAFMGRPPESPFLLNKETIETKAFIGLPWKEQRRFSLHMLRDLGFGKSKMEDLIREEILCLMECIGKNENKPFILRDILAPSMSNNIGALVFGKRFDYDHPVRKLMTRILIETGQAAGQVTWQLFFPWLKRLCKILHIADVDRIHRIAEEFREYTWKEIEEHEKTLDPSNVRDFIDGYLFEIKKRTDDPSFSKPVLQDLSGAFFGAGSETVRITVDWLLLRAASYQKGQRRIQSEIDEVIGPNRFPAWQDQKNMPYTHAFLMELMRWRTIVPINVLRYTLIDTELNGFFIPKHTNVLANLWSIHHDPDYWGEDADEFRPERFLTEDGKEVKKKDHFIPFSIGKRACPGEPLANVEVFLYFVSILQNFNLSLPEGKTADFEGQLGIGLQPKPQEIIYTKRI